MNDQDQRTPSPLASGGKRTIVDEGTAFKGTLSSSCPIIVMGQVEGEITGPTVEVTETGALRGRAKIGTLRSRGEIAGEFDADAVELSGRVRPGTTIRARALEVSLTAEAAEGAGKLSLIFGACALEVGDEPRKEQAVAEALASAKPPAPAAPAPDEAPAAAPAGEAAAPAAEASGTPTAATTVDGERAEASADAKAADGADKDAKGDGGGALARRLKRLAPDRPSVGP